MQSSDKIAIIGSGKMGLSLARGLVKSKYCQPQQIILTRRHINALLEYASNGFAISNDNMRSVEQSSIIVLAVLPKQLSSVLQEIKPFIQAHKHLLISMIAGISCAFIRKALEEKHLCIIRAMPNTAISIGQSTTCIACDSITPIEKISIAKSIFNQVGSTILISEELMPAATALGACGIAFFLRAMRAASQGGVEIGFHAEEALLIVAQAAKGAAELLLQNRSHPEHEIDQVTSPGGCTIAGLNKMEDGGFSSSLVKGIKASAALASDWNG